MKSNRWLISAIGLFFFSTFHIIFARQSSLTENAAGAHSLAMGQAAMASGNDALSSAINPANASTLQSLTASAYHSDFSSTGTINAFGMILPFPKHG
ncbi:MAG: hypothetical protein ACE5I1_28650, partial [bacterium]